MQEIFVEFPLKFTLQSFIELLKACLVKCDYIYIVWY